MPKQALKTIEQERGKPLDRIIPPLVNRVGVVEAGKKLGISAATVGKWLKDNGYAPSTKWGKATTAQEHADIEAAHDRVNAARALAGQPSIEAEVESW